MDLEEIDDITELPIFPLSTVLFPGAILPLHIFEERYKVMMRYAVDNGGMFGLSYRADAQVGRETPPATGSIGCIAKINAVMPLEQGRMNVLSTGLIRYRVNGLRQSEPFLIAAVETFGDELEPGADLTRMVEDTEVMATQFLEAAQSLDEPGIPAAQELSDDPEAFSLLLAGLLPIDNDTKQTLLELTSTRVRITRVRHYLARALADYNARLKVQEIAKTNGHARKSI
ncbi:MAG TPA: LON peptidase substrate-binding domain-containing protein [Blastocatellia bacterium]|nr:LON peptidase substrate-binding domain-containing protein [Blastocatellia bacterium]